MREPWYDAPRLTHNVFDPNGPRVTWPDGGWHAEAKLAEAGLVATARALLEFADEYVVWVAVSVDYEAVEAEAVGGAGTEEACQEPIRWYTRVEKGSTMSFSLIVAPTQATNCPTSRSLWKF